MKLNKAVLVGTLGAIVLSAGVMTGVMANESSHGHDDSMAQQGMPESGMSHNTMTKGSMSHEMMDSQMGQHQMFLEKKDIDGYTVSFHVMAAEEGMKHGGSHNLMIRIDRDGALVNGVQANSKVIFPDGSQQTKPLMTMGEWQMAGYDLKASGKHQLMVLFKTADGKKHFGGLYYGQ